jgi:PAS domain S-box-containing protein
MARMSVLAQPDSAALSLHDSRRLDAVRGTGLLDSVPEDAFDRLTRLAAKLTGAPVTFISLVDDGRDFYKSCFGFPEPLASERQLTGTTFCHYAIVSDGPLVIPNTLEHPVYREVPTVQTLGVQAYLGIPLITSEGHALGSFCAIDFKPRDWSPLDIEVLQELATSTLREIELRAAQAKLSAERHLLETTLQQMPAGVIIASPDGKVIISNARATELLGRRIERVEQKSWPLSRAIENGETVHEERHVLQHPDGSSRSLLVSATPVIDGEIIAGVVTIHDITERERLYDAAQLANQTKDDFFAAVTHELRTPMTAIIGWARLLKMDAGASADAIEAADMIESSARVQARIVDDLLDASRMTAGKIVLALEDVEVSSIIDEAVRAAQPTAEAQGIRLRTNLCSVPMISADRSRLRQIFGNLLSNATKFTPEGGLVTVHATVDDDRVCIAVRDTGRGIPPELLPHIFERGRQARNAEQGGLGLGLTIVRRLVELHGGTISAESEGEGKGSTFTVYLPFATSARS